MPENNKSLEWRQFIFPGAIFVGHALGEIVIRPLYNRNVQPGLEAIFIILYILADIFIIFMVYYLVSIMVSEF